jgi:hypothetical protein
MALTSQQLVHIITIIGILFFFTWGITFFFLRKNPDVLKILFSHGLILRILTVILVIVTTAILALINKLTSEVTAILGGIVGYVLGGIPAVDRRDKSN